MTDAVAIFRRENLAGRGYAPPDRLTSVDDAIASYGGDGYGLEMRAHTDAEVTVMRMNTHVIAIGDVNGAWVVTISE